MAIVLKDESYRIMGACFEVYNSMGCGFLEGVYQECLGIEFSNQTIPFKAQVSLELCLQRETPSTEIHPGFHLF